MILIMIMLMIGMSSEAQTSRFVTMNDTITINELIIVIDSLKKNIPPELPDYQARWRNEKNIERYVNRLNKYIYGLEEYFSTEENGKFKACIQAKRSYYNDFMEKRRKELERLKNKFK